jgi:hypothetical protein
LASVTAGSRKLPLFAIAERVEQRQLGTDDSLIQDHSEAGWITVAVTRMSTNLWIELCSEPSEQRFAADSKRFCVLGRIND